MGRYQPFNDLPAAQFQALVEDIERNGVLLPILVDEDDKTIDGHQRRRAAAEAGVECPRIVVEGLTEDEKNTLALTVNLFRRHLAGVERSKALQQLANLGLSTRRIAESLGLSKSTVHRDLQAGDVERPEMVSTADGRSYPAQRPNGIVPPRDNAPPPGMDPLTGEIGSDQSGSDASDAAGPGDGGAGHDTPDPSPVPKVALDPTLTYRANFTAERSRVRNNLLLFDPERCIATSDEPQAVINFASDLIDFGQRLLAAADGPRLKAVQ